MKEILFRGTFDIHCYFACVFSNRADEDRYGQRFPSFSGFFSLYFCRRFLVWFGRQRALPDIMYNVLSTVAAM